MPQHIDVPGMGVVEFPDGMSDDQIATAIKGNMTAQPATPVGMMTAIGRGAAQGLTLGGFDELRGLSEAGGVKPEGPMTLGSIVLGSYRKLTGTDDDAYKAGKDRAAGDFKTAEQQYPVSTMAGNLGGSIGSAIVSSPISLGARAVGAGTGLGRTVLSSIIDGSLLGGAQGALSADDGQRLSGAGVGSIVGGAVGGAVPAAISLAGKALSPIMANLMAWKNPAAYAERQVGRALSESGRSVDDVTREIGEASAAGQGQFMLADALSNPGQRMLSTVARAPGEGRTMVVNALENRQAGQGRRIANAIMQGFDSPQTAAQTEARMTAQRGAAADAEYGAVRNASDPVDLVAPINQLDRIIGTQPGQVVTPANDSIEAILTPFRQRLARVNPDDFEAVQRIRGDMADAAQNAAQNGYGNRARLIGNSVRELDAAMEGASSGYRQANRNFAQASRNIEAIDTGRTAAQRGRTEDILPAFRALTPQGQAGFRAGYADPLVEAAQGSAFGVNKARPLMSDAFRDEVATIAPMRTQTLMNDRIGRENTMFETRTHALGGSRTADNLADQGGMAVDPAFIGHVLTGNMTGAVRYALQAGSNVMTGNTSAVRREVANILTQNGQTFSRPELARMVDEVVARAQHMQDIARGYARASASAVSGYASQRR